ncbi:MAG: hemerythrin domain-containing protein [Bacteroidales bacterium]
MADMIHLNHFTLDVIERFGIKLGFGNKTIEQVCNENGIPVDFFLEIVNAFIDKDYFPQKQLQDVNLMHIIKYLKKTHESYLQERIPEIEELIDQMESSCYSQKENIILLKKFFSEYKHELENHTNREDTLVFPHAELVHNTYQEKKPSAEALEQIKKYSMKQFEQEHDNIEEKLYDLKNIIIKYLPPPKNQQHCRKLLYALFSLEKDINDHSRIEDKVLVPKVAELEKLVLSQHG